MSDEVFLSMTPNERAHAARVLYQSHSKPRNKEKWWGTYMSVLSRLDAVDFDWSKITLDKQEQSWRDYNRTKRNLGTLTTEQHKALKIMGFQFNQTLDTGDKPRATPQFNEVVDLLQRSKDPEATPLTDDEQTKLTREINRARKRYEDGLLSEKRALILGIIPR